MKRISRIYGSRVQQSIPPESSFSGMPFDTAFVYRISLLWRNVPYRKIPAQSSYKYIRATFMDKVLIFLSLTLNRNLLLHSSYVHATLQCLHDTKSSVSQKKYEPNFSGSRYNLLCGKNWLIWKFQYGGYTKIYWES